MAMAIFSLVPTPSALETSTGSFHFLVSRAKSAPKPPIPPRTRGREGAAGVMANALLGVVGDSDVYSGIGVFHGEPLLFRCLCWNNRVRRHLRQRPAVAAAGSRAKARQSTRGRQRGASQRWAANKTSSDQNIWNSLSPAHGAGMDDGIARRPKSVRESVRVPRHRGARRATYRSSRASR